MLNKISNALVAPLIVAIVAGVVLWYLGRSVPDVKYTLSESIPVSFLNSGAIQSESIQQLKVRNLGNAEAKRIVVKINDQMTSYEIKKYSTVDVVQEFTSQQSSEFVYPQLPPQAGFQIIFKVPGNGIKSEELSVSDDSGIAQAALAQTDTSSNWLVVSFYIATITFYLYMIGSGLRKSSLDIRKLDAKNKKVQQILQLKKPWYP